MSPGPDPGLVGPPSEAPGPAGPEVTTVGYDEVVIHTPAGPDGSGGWRPAEAHRFADLAPDTEHRLMGLTVRTLPRPPGELLAVVATLNDLHFGETRAGHIEGSDVGPVLSSGPGEAPYPLTMNGAAAADIAALDRCLPTGLLGAVVAKGDLTDAGARADLDAFEACYRAFGDRLHAIPGNHDVAGGPVEFGPGPFGRRPPFEVVLDGVILALLDTTIAGWPTGRVSPEQIEWLDELGARADRPVLVLGHHHAWDPGYSNRSPTYYGINPEDSEALVAVVARRPRLAGYFAGHTHRNRVRQFGPTGAFPWVEVASVKEFPGCWAEYRIHEGGAVQILRRLDAPEALEWSERTRALYHGHYTAYAFGASPADRCFPIPFDRPLPRRH
ncbi:MAG TPA: metallophosphoesterase [Acidimicrobiales bacterium]|nr:metallophosphoesterase [Acidimicrobiales bacterium]